MSVSVRSDRLTQLLQAEVDRIWGRRAPRQRHHVLLWPVELAQLLPPGLLRMYHYVVSGYSPKAVPVTDTVRRTAVARLRHLLHEYCPPETTGDFTHQLRRVGWQVHPLHHPRPDPRGLVVWLPPRLLNVWPTPAPVFRAFLDQVTR